MRRKFLFLPLSFVLGTTLLASCTAHLNVKDNGLIQLGDKTYTIGQIYDTQLDTATAAKSYYDLLDNVYTQLGTPVDAEMKAAVETDITKNLYDAAKTNAKNNGTSQKEEEEKILQAQNVDTVEEYRQKLTLQKQTDAASKTFYSDTNLNSTLTRKWAEEQFPYHMKHVLVKVSASGTELHRGRITSTEAKNLSNVVTRLASGNKFGDVALNSSEDTGSAKVFGDISESSGPMTKSGKGSGLVNEFRLGTYAWDMLYNNSADNAKAMASVGPTDKTVTAFTGSNTAVDETSYTLFGIPFSSALALGQYAETEKDATGHAVANATEDNYPRNVIFNNYYNNLSLNLVYFSQADLDSIEANYGIHESDVLASFKTAYDSALSNPVFKTVSEMGLTNKIFQYQAVTKVSDGKAYSTYETVPVPSDAKVLTDERGKAILVTRSGTGSSSSSSSGGSSSATVAKADSSSSSSGSTGYQGVHFIVPQNDPFEESEDQLVNYYKIDYAASTAENAPQDYTNFVKYATAQEYTDKRFTPLRTAVQSDNPSNKFDLFENKKKQVADQGITVNVPSNVQALVDKYIADSKASDAYSTLTSFDNSWNDYLSRLAFQQATVSNNVPLSVSLDQFSGGVIKRYIDLSKVDLSTGAVPSDAYTDTYAAEWNGSNMGTAWIYNPAYVSDGSNN